MSLDTNIIYKVQTHNNFEEFFDLKIDVRKKKATIVQLGTITNKFFKQKNKYDIKFTRCWLGSENGNIDVSSMSFTFNPDTALTVKNPREYNSALFQIDEFHYVFIYDKIAIFAISEQVLKFYSPMSKSGYPMPYVETKSYSVVLNYIRKNCLNFITVKNVYRKLKHKNPYEVIDSLKDQECDHIPNEAYVEYKILE